MPPPSAYDVYQNLEREEQFAPKEGKTQSSYAILRERATGRSLRRGLIIIGACWILYFIYLNRIYSMPFFQYSQNDDGKNATDAGVSTTIANQDGARNTVPLDVHIMSKCPDAEYCLHNLIVPAMEKISDKVDFQLSFIGNLSDSTSDIECKHGPTECIGNMLMLCAANLPFPPTETETSPVSPTSRTPVIRSLGFANCLISDYKDIPSRTLVQNCALEHGIDFEALNACASRQEDYEGEPISDGPSGIALFRQSASHSLEVGVTKSCTVRLDENVWCIRDDKKWKNCTHGSDVSTFVDEVERLWKERN